MTHEQFQRLLLLNFAPLELHPLNDEQRANLRAFVSQATIDLFLGHGMPVQSIIVCENSAAAPLALYDVQVRLDR